MEFMLSIAPNQQSIFFIDQVMENYTQLYNISDARDICFVTHELVINAVEAMNKANRQEDIQLHVLSNDEQIKITVADFAEGIPQEQWQSILEPDLGEMCFSDRGRGFFFIIHMVDKLWFEQLPSSQFLVGIKKSLID
ncbi:ATP-binding protein [Metasolibacillus sp. FSL H7-0170]|uniref:ATP-binding protein n=1 Tax=Metasolibacillus TaxID=2703677 RepID=UPI000D33E4BE|nr:ATP-binding protein [Metasolibacillus fluoroglycofenilyticus]